MGEPWKGCIARARRRFGRLEGIWGGVQSVSFIHVRNELHDSDDGISGPPFACRHPSKVRCSEECDDVTRGLPCHLLLLGVYAWIDSCIA